MRDNRSMVAVTGGAQMRRQECIEPQLLIAVEPTLDCQNIAARSRGYSQQKRIALVPVHDLDRRDARR
jgi:hypothetical protein